MKVTHLVFNPHTLKYSLNCLFNDGSTLHVGIASDAVEEFKRRNAVPREYTFGNDEYNKHMIYWDIQ